VSPEFRSSLMPPEEPSGFPSGTDQASDQRHPVQREWMPAPEASTELLAYPPLKVAQHPRTQFSKQPLSGQFRSYADVVGASSKPPSQLPPCWRHDEPASLSHLLAPPLHNCLPVRGCSGHLYGPIQCATSQPRPILKWDTRAEHNDVTLLQRDMASQTHRAQAEETSQPWQLVR
jgi:hypothetical protein